MGDGCLVALESEVELLPPTSSRSSSSSIVHGTMNGNRDSHKRLAAIQLPFLNPNLSKLLSWNFGGLERSLPVLLNLRVGLFICVGSTADRDDENDQLILGAILKNNEAIPLSQQRQRLPIYKIRASHVDLLF